MQFSVYLTIGLETTGFWKHKSGGMKLFQVFLGIFVVVLFFLEEKGKTLICHCSILLTHQVI